MEDIRLIASDMDHTLLTESGELPPDFHSWIDRLNQAGIVFVAASGRPIFTLRSMFPAGGPGLAYIGDNGGTVSYNGEILSESLLPARDYRSMIALTHSQTNGIPIICGVDAGYVAAAHREHEDFLRTFYSELVFVDDLTQITPDADKFTVYFPEGNAHELCEKIYQPRFDEAFSVTIGGRLWVDIMNRGVTKGNGLRVLAAHLGLEPEQMMAFGDTLNDIEMLDEVYFSYAVSNADDAVRRTARFSTGSNDEYGVLNVIKELLAKRGPAMTDGTDLKKSLDC